MNEDSVLISFYYIWEAIYYVLEFEPAYGFFLTQRDVFNDLSEMLDLKYMELPKYNKSQSNLKERLFNSNILEAYEVGTLPHETDLSFQWNTWLLAHFKVKVKIFLI